MKPREYTPDEAEAALPRLRELLPALREAHHRQAFLRDQAEDLQAMYGERLADPGCDAHEDHARLRADLAEAETEVRALLMEFQALGVEVKDPVVGLVDFYHRRDGELVYLCWREDEAHVGHWHPLVGGFAARRPL